MVKDLYIKNARVHTENEGTLNGSVLISDGKITKLYTDHNSPIPPDAEVIDANGLHLIPGFIDGHIHGAAGADVMDGTPEALSTMAKALPAEGTTGFLATTITQSPENIEKALKNVAGYTSRPGQAEVIGIHLEGPFIEKSKKGAQPAEYIQKPDINLFKKWQELSDNKIRTITMAPEHDADGSFTKYLHQTGVNVSAGHTGTGFEGMQQAVSHGVRQVTHLCNAMSGIHHRDIGVVGAAFKLKELRAELIADGIHVSPQMLDLIYQNIGSERLILITDAMRAKCLQAGDYELGGQAVKVTEDRAVLNDGTLAGSILQLVNGAKQMMQLDGVTIDNIIEMASENPARQLGIFGRKGSIAEGKDADLLLVDNNLTIKYTFCRGIIAHQEV
ncbi:N-acetylglucosamine-6-phosphate deacetylase [Virgibacillus kekensis]|uniref:N-acetylglucosamine-6-phosphate deacetylase n=1 Tax=Virgibacillus kekensis TaxID=202261 RepID=A0ABV9DGN9_9BACI